MERKALDGYVTDSGPSVKQVFICKGKYENRLVKLAF